MREIGYESYNCILNLGSIYIFGLLYIIMLVLFVTFSLIKFLSLGYFKFKFLYSWQNNLFFSFLLELLFEGYIEILITSFLNISVSLDSKDGEKWGFVSAIVLVIVCMLIIPVLLGWIWK